jgi:3,5-epimerase/4-reductase
MTKYLVFGNGFIGNRFANFLQDSTISYSRINKIDDVDLQIKIHDPEVVINTIGKTGRPNVDWCELNKDETFFSNVTVPTLIAEACENANIRFVHIGSGCIYQTDEHSYAGFSETDRPNFKGSFHSRTKIFAENILSEYGNILQLRIRMPIDDIPSPRNLIDKLIGYKYVIGDIPNSITCIPDLMTTAKILMDRNEIGIFNVINRGVITHKQILSIYKQMVDPSYEMPTFVGLEKLKELTLAERSNCILYNARLEGKGIRMRHVLEAVEDCMRQYAKYK